MIRLGNNNNNKKDQILLYEIKYNKSKRRLSIVE